jgi:hypothetical protein
MIVITAVMWVSVCLPVASSRISATGFCFSLMASVVAEDDEEDTNKPTSSEKIWQHHKKRIKQ